MRLTLEDLRARYKEEQPKPDENGLYDVKLTEEEYNNVVANRTWTDEDFAHEWDIKVEPRDKGYPIDGASNSEYVELSFTTNCQSVYVKERDDAPIEHSITRNGRAMNITETDGVTIGVRGGGMEIPQFVWVLRIMADKLEAAIKGVEYER